MAAAVALASPRGARFERSVLRGIYPGRANEVDRCLNSKGVRRHSRHYYYSTCYHANYLRRYRATAANSLP